MPDFQNIDPGDTGLRGFAILSKSSVDPITSGQVDWFLKALSGPNAGKWWDTSDGLWKDIETPNPMTYENADGAWTCSPLGNGETPFQINIRFVEYAKESNLDHIPVHRWLTALIPFAPGSPIDLAAEPVPYIRTFVLVNSSNGFSSEDAKYLSTANEPQVFAVDFRNTCSSNQKVYRVDSVSVIEGDADGLNIMAAPDWTRDGGTQARFTMFALNPGSYKVRVAATLFNPGTPAQGDLRIEVVE